MAEENIYSDNDVSITTARIIVSGTTYALRNITSVKMTATKDKPVIAVVLVIVGVILVWVGLFRDTVSSAIGSVIVGGLLLAVGIAWVRIVKPTFHVTIASSSGEIRALSSPNRPYIETIVGAINEAIIRYR